MRDKMASSSSRAGRYVQQPAGYRAFLPAPLPPEPPLQIDTPMLAALSRADQALGRLDGLARTLPNPDLFVAMYVRREAVLSSQIEGTQSTLEDVLTYELDPSGRDLPLDVEEVVNYVRAMNYGLERLASLPLSLRLLREIPGELLQGVRGADRQPGEFRRSQNWIGPANVPLAQASFVPPPPAELSAVLGNLESFLHLDGADDLPVLIQCGLAHAQFETIHPFLDGNGRVGRLLITFLLVYRGVLSRPLLYLSLFLRRHRGEYYERLTAVRSAGDWEGWLRFFLRGVAETAEEATVTAEEIMKLREQHRIRVQGSHAAANGLRLLDLIFRYPLLTPNTVRDSLGISPATAYKLLDRFVAIGILEVTPGAQRNRRFRYTPYLRLFNESATEPDGPNRLLEPVPVEATEN
jgi:Fic family protein